VRFLIDAQLPPALAAWIAERGHETAPVADLHISDASDEAVWSAALQTGSIIVTKDHDFVEWATARRPNAAVVWMRTLIARLDVVWDSLVKALEAGALVVEAGRP